MIPTLNGTGAAVIKQRENIAYIRQMLGELRGVANNEGADMLCYLLEMAYVEAGDILNGQRQLSVSKAERNKTASMPVKSPGQIKF